MPALSAVLLLVAGFLAALLTLVWSSRLTFTFSFRLTISLALRSTLAIFLILLPGVLVHEATPGRQPGYWA